MNHWCLNLSLFLECIFLNVNSSRRQDEKLVCIADFCKIGASHHNIYNSSKYYEYILEYSKCYNISQIKLNIGTLIDSTGSWLPSF